MSAAPPRRTRMARSEREAQILAVAHEQFAARGFAAVTMDEVAAEVGVTKPLLASGEVAERVAEHRERLARLVATLIEQLVDPATPEPGPAADGLAHALLGAAESLARWWLATEALSAPATAELLLAAVEPGIREAAAGRNLTENKETKTK